MKRPLTLCSSDCPSPVPAAIERHVAAADRLAMLQHVQFVALEHGHRVRHRLEVVQQPHLRDVERTRDGDRVDPERHVRQLRGRPEHRAPRRRSMPP